jgi:hypothetical protein
MNSLEAKKPCDRGRWRCGWTGSARVPTKVWSQPFLHGHVTFRQDPCRMLDIIPLFSSIHFQPVRLSYKRTSFVRVRNGSIPTRMVRHYTEFLDELVALTFNGEHERQSCGSMAGTFGFATLSSRGRWAVPSLASATGIAHSNVHFDANEAVSSEQRRTSAMPNAVRVKLDPARMCLLPGTEEMLVPMGMHYSQDPEAENAPVRRPVETPHLFSQPTRSCIGALGYREDPLILRATGHHADRVAHLNTA